MTALVWFRNDLRLADNPALRAALKLGEVVPIYLHVLHEEHPWEPGGASRWWLHHSLNALEAELRAAGSRLIVRAAKPGESSLHILEALVKETESTAVYWNRRYEPAGIKHDTETMSVLRSRGIAVETLNANWLFEPGTIRNQQGNPFQVFTPFWKTCLKHADTIAVPLPKPRDVPGPKTWPKSVKIDELGLLPRIKWDAGLAEMWTPGEAGAHERWRTFLREPIQTYKSARDIPAEQGTSMLSPHLHFGEISPRQLWHELLKDLAWPGTNEARTRKGSTSPVPSPSLRSVPGHPKANDVVPIHAKAQQELDKSDAGHFLREVGWREFSQHLLYHYPETPEQPLREKYRDFPWRMKPQGGATGSANAAKRSGAASHARADHAGATGYASAGKKAERDLRAWQRGQTGYPIVDAGMRQLWHTGWMHNRVRMIVGSFLVKHLLLPWQEGAAWFWETLVDADLGNNTLGWQWVAGCGADAAPYFRIFNPVLQGQKFDARGEYVRKWVPELSTMPDDYLHAPWDAPREVMQAAKIKLGRDYPEPIVDHKEAREGALAALAKLKE